MYLPIILQWLSAVTILLTKLLSRWCGAHLLPFDSSAHKWHRLLWLFISPNAPRLPNKITRAGYGRLLFKKFINISVPAEIFVTMIPWKHLHNTIAVSDLKISPPWAFVILWFTHGLTAAVNELIKLQPEDEWRKKLVSLSNVIQLNFRRKPVTMTDAAKM